MISKIADIIQSFRSKDIKLPEVVDLSAFVATKVSKKWYESAGSSRISNISAVHGLFTALEKKDPVAFFGLYANHVVDYTTVWGPAAFSFRNEYNWKAWVVPLSESENLILFSAKGGGSSFEVTGPNVGSYPGVLSEVATSNLLNILWTIQDRFGNPHKLKVREQIKTQHSNSPEP
jgi:hypothetical protein